MCKTYKFFEMSGEVTKTNVRKDCTKKAEGRTRNKGAGLCKRHGGGQRCTYLGCIKGALGF